MKSDDEDEDLIPLTAPGMATPEEGGKVLSAEQRTDPACDGSLPLGKERRMAHSPLLELLQAAASIMAELHHEEERWTEVQRSHVETKFPPPFPTKREPLWYSPRLRPPSCQKCGARSPPNPKIRLNRLWTFHLSGDDCLS
ncbi:unnamed protein product [Lampetra planeri]